MTKIENFRHLPGRLANFFSVYHSIFRTRTRPIHVIALLYLKGLMMCQKKNCQVMAEELPDAGQQRLQHFISYSN